MKLRLDGRPDGRSKHATFQHWLREHAPLAYSGLYAGNDEIALAAERKRRSELWELARVKRDALAYCVECRNPLVATEQGFQFCLYQRAGQRESYGARFLNRPRRSVPRLSRSTARQRAGAAAEFSHTRTSSVGPRAQRRPRVPVCLVFSGERLTEIVEHIRCRKAPSCIRVIGPRPQLLAPVVLHHGRWHSPNYSLVGLSPSET